eukprot:TRINITY_DN89832_c0_g1_i1.p1 TRINITY_DN89832_c0_g1~~TRINITY_DN89832_c0_g1_i1.p1  ORF type:complete len:781 (-),score=77.16 TRINITY_DN89832_c0_g1_i1:486-2828(-)
MEGLPSAVLRSFKCYAALLFVLAAISLAWSLRGATKVTSPSLPGLTRKVDIWPIAKDALFRSDATMMEDVVHQTPPNLTLLETSNPCFYTRPDVRQFAIKSKHLFYNQDGLLPRVLVYAWGDISALARHSLAGGVPRASPAPSGGAPRAAAWVLQYMCYTKSHGFDLRFESEQTVRERQGPLHGQMQQRQTDPFYLMIRDMRTHISNGQYDYIFLMMDGLLINDMHFEFPVWAYDHGHDITLMDQAESMDGFPLNAVLFRASSATGQFLQSLLNYQEYSTSFIQSGQGAFLEMMLRSLGLEAEANGDNGYVDTCLKLAYRQHSDKHDHVYRLRLAAYSHCFFSELARLAGPYGYRASKLIGFSRTYASVGKALAFHDMQDEKLLLPKANCHGLFQLQPHSPEDCFAFSWLDASSATYSGTRECPAPGVPSSPWKHFYGGNDLFWFRDWSQRSRYSGPPKVLIYTWCTESSFSMFVNEAYWKACYAHAHGYDIVFSDVLNVDGVKKMQNTDGTDLSQQWYADDLMWAWNRDAMRYIFSGKYDYVFHVGADVLFHYLHLDFPLWAYDTGHGVTIMDQDYVSYGWNQNAVLFKPTDFTKRFLDSHFSYRRDFWLQGDNGPWMENLLVFLGEEAELAGLPGYKKICEEHGKLTMPSAVWLKTDFRVVEENCTRYSKCFFAEIDRLAGPYGSRTSAHIGFSKTINVIDGMQVLPEHTSVMDSVRVLPWANCFSHVRDHWTGWQGSCFASHWNGPKSAQHRAAVDGTCPDPSFAWAASPWNFVNRR